MNTDMIADVMGAETERDAARREAEELRGQVERMVREREYWRTIVMRRAESEPWLEEVIRLNNRIEEMENEKRSGAIVYRLAHEGESLAELARLRSLLKGALVPCDKCHPMTESSGSVTCGTCQRSAHPGFVPFRSEP